MVDARTATAADLDAAATRLANGFWVWVLVGVVVVIFWRWLALFPFALAALKAAQSISATKAADKLRRGTYTIPNPNNGAPDGDARNLLRTAPAATRTPSAPPLQSAAPDLPMSPELSTGWYYLGVDPETTSTKAAGPFDLAQMITWVQNGFLKATSQVWHPTFGKEWRTTQRVQAFNVPAGR